MVIAEKRVVLRLLQRYLRLQLTTTQLLKMEYIIYTSKIYLPKSNSPLQHPMTHTQCPAISIICKDTALSSKSFCKNRSMMSTIRRTITTIDTNH